MTANDFESACETAIGGWLWDETFSRLYTERVSLGIVEMREIANALRYAEGIKAGTVKTFSTEAAEQCKEDLR